MTDKKAMAMALEALEGVLDDAPKVLDASISGGLYEVVQCRDAITALKERLADPMREVQRLGQEIEQEPPQRTEQNFCSRCGKRTPDLTHIHTCTPPKENT